jgi:hypothetical protein
MPRTGRAEQLAQDERDLARLGYAQPPNELVPWTMLVLALVAPC